MRANGTYSEAKRQLTDRNRDVLMNVHSPHKWWSTLKSAVFGSCSSLPPLVSEGGGLVWGSVGKADLLELSGVLPTTQFAYRKDLGTCDSLFCVSHTLQIILESGQEARIV